MRTKQKSPEAGCALKLLLPFHATLDHICGQVYVVRAALAATLATCKKTFLVSDKDNREQAVVLLTIFRITSAPESN